MTAFISLSPASGLVGTSVTVTGTGFAASKIVTLNWDGGALTCTSGCSTDATGSFTGHFAVPSATAGAHIVKATDASSNSAQATFTVVTQYQVTFTSSGIAGDSSGTVVTVNSVNYAQSQLPFTATYNSGSSVTYSYASPVSGDRW